MFFVWKNQDFFYFCKIISLEFLFLRFLFTFTSSLKGKSKVNSRFILFLKYKKEVYFLFFKVPKILICYKFIGKFGYKLENCREIFFQDKSKQNTNVIFVSLRTRRIRLETILSQIFTLRRAPRVLVLLFHRRKRNNHRHDRLRRDRIRVLQVQWEQHRLLRRPRLLRIRSRTQTRIRLTLNKRRSIIIIVLHLPDLLILLISIPRYVYDLAFISE